MLIQFEKCYHQFVPAVNVWMTSSSNVSTLIGRHCIRAPASSDSHVKAYVNNSSAITCSNDEWWGSSPSGQNPAGRYCHDDRPLSSRHTRRSSSWWSKSFVSTPTSAEPQHEPFAKVKPLPRSERLYPQYIETFFRDF